MTKHPVLSALAVALVFCTVAAIAWPFTNQEAPWALTLIAVAFPFVWFLAWAFINTAAWWLETTDEDR